MNDSNIFSDLPAEISSQLMSFLEEKDGELHIVDDLKFVDFIVQNGLQYPALLNLIKLNEEFVIENFERTGEVPPGVKLVKKTTEDGSNVTRLEVFYSKKTEK